MLESVQIASIRDETNRQAQLHEGGGIRRLGERELIVAARRALTAITIEWRALCCQPSGLIDWYDSPNRAKQFKLST